MIHISHGKKQRTKIFDTYILRQEILSEVIEDSILWSLLFNTDICDLFFILKDCDIASYKNYNKRYLSGQNLDKVLNILDIVSLNVFQNFNEN